MSNYFEELIERDVKRATKKNSESIARSLLKIGTLTLEAIATATGLTLERVQKLAATMQRA